MAALQAAVRLVPDDVASWEALGDSYRTLGRYTGSLKVQPKPLKIASIGDSFCSDAYELRRGFPHVAAACSHEDKTRMFASLNPRVLLISKMCLAACGVLADGCMWERFRQLHGRFWHVPMCGAGYGVVACSWQRLQPAFHRRPASIIFCL